jgi:LacI family transcriptional regulator
MQDIGLSAEWIIEGDHTLEGGMRALDELVAMRSRPTGVLCSNDMTAIGVMREAYGRGILIPQDLSVIGFDDIRLSQFVTPPLTTVQMSQKELARIAFEALKNEAEQKPVVPGKVEFDLVTSLVLRSSTALAHR